jgi:hypothetical protein
VHPLALVPFINVHHRASRVASVHRETNEIAMNNDRVARNASNAALVAPNSDRALLCVLEFATVDFGDGPDRREDQHDHDEQPEVRRVVDGSAEGDELLPPVWRLTCQVLDFHSPTPPRWLTNLNSWG